MCACPRPPRSRRFQDFTSPLRAIFGVFALLALTITGLLIYSLISVAVEERIREYAILRTLGAKRRRHLPAGAERIVPALFPRRRARRARRRRVSQVYCDTRRTGDERQRRAARRRNQSRPHLLLTLAGGRGVFHRQRAGSRPRRPRAGGSWMRWIRCGAGQIPAAPVTEGQVNRPLVVTGLALSALSVVVFFVLPTAFLSGNPSLIGTVVLCLLVSILLGLHAGQRRRSALCAAALVVGSGPAFGPAAELAGRNLDRHRRRHTTTALLFTLSVSLVIFIASLVALASRTALALVEHTHGADLRIEVRAHDRIDKPDLPASRASMPSPKPGSSTADPKLASRMTWLSGTSSG